MKASEIFIKALENEGVEYIFTVPGEETLDLIDSISKSKKIKLIVLRHEQGAGFMAATLGRFTGKAGVCLVTLGPGATNLITSVAYAQLGGFPMIVISGQKPILEHKHGRFQVIDVVSMMKPITKSAKQIIDIKNIPSYVRQAFHIAEEERPGVVHLELPEDIAQERGNMKTFQPHRVYRPNADVTALNLALKMIENSIQPLILVGAGANRKKTSESLTKFVKKTGIPFFCTQMGKGTINEKSEFYLGTAALSAGDFVHKAIAQADLIINAGHDIIEKPPFCMNHNLKKNTPKVIHINYESSEIADNYFPELEIIGDINSTINYMVQNIKISKKWNFNAFKKIEQKLTSHIKSYSNDSSFPMKIEKIICDIQKTMENGIVSLDNGLYKIYFARNYFSKNIDSLVLDNALATMGAGISSAMACKLINKDKQVLAVCGDGGFIMGAHQLEPAVRLKLNITILVLVDNAYGMIKWKQKNLGLKNFGMDFQNPDFVKYAQSHGAKGYRVTTAKEFLPILNKSLNEDAVSLIEVPIKY